MDEILQIFIEEGSKLNFWQTGIRGVLVFVITVLIVRLGKRKFMGKNSALDIILAVMIGSMASRSITGSAHMLQTFVTIALLIAAHALLSILSVKSRTIASFLEGSGFLLLKDGKIDEKALHGQLLRKEDIIEAARLRGQVSDLNKIKEAYLESNGSISVIKEQ